MPPALQQGSQAERRRAGASCARTVRSRGGAAACPTECPGADAAKAAAADQNLSMFGQRCWRTSAKHLAPSSSPERLAKPDAGLMAKAPRALQASHPIPASGANRTTLEPDKSQTGRAWLMLADEARPRPDITETEAA